MRLLITSHSSRSALFANSAIFVFGTSIVKATLKGKNLLFLQQIEYNLGESILFSSSPDR